MAGIVPNYDRQITRRLAVMQAQLRKVYAATGTRSIKQLKEFIILGGSRHPDDGEFRHPDIILSTPSEDNGISRELILKHPDHQFGTQQRFRVQHVNGKDHLVATEKIISDWELLNLILLKLEFPRQFIPEPILAELEVEHAPFSPLHNEINPRSDGAAWINSLPDDLHIEISEWLNRNNWIDVEELFERANRLQQLREWKRGLQQGHAGRSLLLNLPEEGPANSVGTFVTGIQRTGGRRPGKHNLVIKDQELVSIIRLLPKIPDVSGVRLPDAYRNRQHYLEEMREHSWVWQDHLDRIFGPGGPAAARARAAARRAARAAAGAGAGAEDPAGGPAAAGAGGPAAAGAGGPAAAGAGGPAAAGAGDPAAAEDARTRKRKTRKRKTRNRKTRKNRK
jgi:hypothetical protein